MSYELIAPPFALTFRDRTRDELKYYYQWYLALIPSRMEVLIREVQAQEKFRDTDFDYTPQTLVSLGEWFGSSVETRPRTAAEFEKINKNAKFPIKVSDVELTNKTFSIAIDVGMYLSQVFLSRFSDLKWQHILGGKNSVDYGQPVLSPFKTLVFNPTQMLVTQAYGISRGSKDGTSLLNLFNIWADMKDDKKS